MASSLRTLRGAAVRPLFLAAPGVANGQSAYFSFVAHLSWSEQPIYTLEKDDSKTIEELAAVHVEDILRIQPRGPYLLGGHSYGGVVAMEVALQLERRGSQVGHVFVFDAPHPLQVRAPVAGSTADDADAEELMEMILNAIDFGHTLAGWDGMTMFEKYEYFAPVWRVMRDARFTVAEVREQVLAVAQSVKTGSSRSDLRHHRFVGRLKNAKVTYFRASIRGAVVYMDDAGIDHGVRWCEVADDLEVVDVPGDHFTMIRVQGRDMDVLVETMKARLASYGWVVRGGALIDDEKGVLSAEEANEMRAYLQKMGVSVDKAEGLEAMVDGLSGGLPKRKGDGDPKRKGEAVAAEEGDNNASFERPLVALNAVAFAASASLQEGAAAEEAMIVVHDATGDAGCLRQLMSRVHAVPVFGLVLPPALAETPVCGMAIGATSLKELAAHYARAVQRAAAKLDVRRVSVAGFGVCGHALAVALGEALLPRRHVRVLAFDPDTNDAEVAFVVHHAAARFPNAESPEVFVHALHGAAGEEETLKRVARLRPAGVDRRRWDGVVARAIRAAATVSSIVSAAPSSFFGVTAVRFLTTPLAAGDEATVGLPDLGSAAAARRVEAWLTDGVVSRLEICEAALEEAARLPPLDGCSVEARAIALVLEAAGVADAEAVAMRLCRADADAATVVHQLHAAGPPHPHRDLFDGAEARRVRVERAASAWTARTPGPHRWTRARLRCSSCCCSSRASRTARC